MPLVVSMERRLSTTTCLRPYGAKLTLVNSVLASLDKLRRTCLWRKKTEDGIKCNSLAAWDLVCQPEEKGGLGVLNFKIQNQGLLMKFLHKFCNKQDVPWVQLV